jgi:hypothetical protein
MASAMPTPATESLLPGIIAAKMQERKKSPEYLYLLA